MDVDLDTLKDEVWGKLNLLTVGELADICGGLGLTVQPAQEGKKSALYGLVMRQLTSLEVEGMEETQGKDLFENVKGAIDNLLQLRAVKEEKVAVLNDNGDQAGEGTAGNVATSSTQVGAEAAMDKGKALASKTGSVQALTQGFAKMAAASVQGGVVSGARKLPEYVRLKREFRVDGTVGTGSKDSLAFESLCYTIEQGKANGYTPQEIIAGCIRATKQNSLRFYLENNPQISEEEFLETLKIHYNGKQSVKLLNEMSKRYQGDSLALEKEENEVQFCMRMIGYCRQITKVAAEENQPMDRSLIQKTFYESLATGFKQGAVRLELQKTLRDGLLTDNQLLHEINLVMNKEIEHKNKMEADKSYVEVKEVDILNGREFGNTGNKGSSMEKGEGARREMEKGEGMVFSAINALTAQVSELTTYTKTKDKEMQEMQKQLTKCWSKLGEFSGEEKDKKKDRKVWFKQCDNCSKANIRYCRHCFVCGADDHKIADCPENP